MASNHSKKRFEVQENETITDCLDRMKNEGYTPVRRIERPVFKKTEKGGKVEHAKQKVVFEAVLAENTNDRK